VFGLLRDSEKARLFLTKVNMDEALDTLSKLCDWDSIRTKAAVATAQDLRRLGPAALLPPCDTPDGLKALMFMQTQEGLTIQDQLPTALTVVCDWYDEKRAAKAIEEASRESGLDLIAASPIALATHYDVAVSSNARCLWIRSNLGR
jgi:hypothetical protein